MEPVVSILISQWSKAKALIQPTFINVTLLRWITTPIYISFVDSLRAAKTKFNRNTKYNKVRYWQQRTSDSVCLCIKRRSKLCDLRSLSHHSNGPKKVAGKLQFFRHHGCWNIQRLIWVELHNLCMYYVCILVTGRQAVSCIKKEWQWLRSNVYTTDRNSVNSNKIVRNEI